MKQSVPKQYLLTVGKPMIVHTLECIEKISAIKEIVVVNNKDYERRVKSLINTYSFKKSVIVYGGQTRQESVYEGLKAAKCDNIIVHEAARPFVKYEEFEVLLNDSRPNVIYANRIPFTVVMEDLKRNAI